jgi:hypothetical protein
MDHSNKTVVRVPLPEGTTYWVYWIGVGTEAKSQMVNFVKKISKIPTSSINPIYAFGIGAIAELPYFKSTATIDYYFANNYNASVFESRNTQNFNYYSMKKGSNITSDYSKIEDVPKELNICFLNNNTFTGHDVSIRVGAFIVKKQWIPLEDMGK